MCRILATPTLQETAENSGVFFWMVLVKWYEARGKTTPLEANWHPGINEQIFAAVLVMRD